MTPIEHAYALIERNRAAQAALAESYGWQLDTLAPGQRVTVQLPTWGSGVMVERTGRVVGVAGSVVVVAIDGPLGSILRRVKNSQVRGI